MRLFKITLILMMAFLFQGSQMALLQGGMEKTGIIISINLEYQSIVIDQNEYRLSDNLSITTKDNIARGNGILSNGQKIKFRVVTEANTGMMVINAIQVLSDIKIQS